MPDMFSTWSSPPEQLVLAPDAVHVWLVELEAADSTVERDFAILSTDEQQRAERFRFPGGKRRYTIARGSLRPIWRWSRLRSAFDTAGWANRCWAGRTSSRI